ncbi:hypothetical protein ACFWTC_25585 [Streptomyces sp. NPDC058619]|uniref:hypothetical protein n=2 Tax=unclassified Streptomyces TaxID=2593676 RepID=UPI003655C8BF
MKPGRCFRVLRAAMFAALCVLLAATGHLLMSGAAVPWWAMGAACAGTAATAWGLAGRERGPLAVTAVAVAVQAVLHAVFSLAQSLVHPSLPTGTSLARQWAEYVTCGSGTRAAIGGSASHPLAESAAHAHHAPHELASAFSAGTALPGTVLPGGALSGGGHGVTAMSPAGMLSAHLLAAVLCGLWLAYGERAVFRVLRAVAGRLGTPLRLLLHRPATPLRPGPHARRTRQHRTPRRLFLVHAITSRGPPTGTAVL